MERAMRVTVYRVVLQRTRGKNASRVALMSAGRARARRAAAISFSTDGTTPAAASVRRRPPSSTPSGSASASRAYFSETMVMRGGTSSALISGYSTFLRLRSEARCCRRGRFLSHAEFGRERGAAMERNDASHDGTGRGRSVGQRSVGREERSSRDTSRERSSARGPLNPTSAGSPRAPPPGARPRPRDFRFQGFGGLSARRTFLGLVLVWPLVALGLTCVAARTTRRTGAPIMTAMFLCVEWREGALLGVKARPTWTAIIVIEKGEKKPRRRGPLFGRAGGVRASGRFHSKMHELKRMKKRRLLAIHRIG